MRYDLGSFGIVYRHCSPEQLAEVARNSGFAWITDYANGVQRRCVVDKDGRVLYARWKNLGGNVVPS